MSDLGPFSQSDLNSQERGAATPEAPSNPRLLAWDGGVGEYVLIKIFPPQVYTKSLVSVSFSQKGSYRLPPCWKPCFSVHWTASWHSSRHCLLNLTKSLVGSFSRLCEIQWHVNARLSSPKYSLHQGQWLCTFPTLHKTRSALPWSRQRGSLKALTSGAVTAGIVTSGQREGKDIEGLLEHIWKPPVTSRNTWGRNFRRWFYVLCNSWAEIRAI